MIDSPDPATPVVAVLLSREPPILWGPCAPDLPAGPGTTLADAFGNRRVYFLVAPTWSMEAREEPYEFEAIRALQARYSNQRYIVLCNTQAEVELCRGQSIPAILCSGNVFVDENIFTIDQKAIKQFDAIYNALFRPFKRHELCRNIESLGLIYYFFDDDPPMRPVIEQMLPQATLINDLGGAYRNLPGREVATWLNRARVGLCLSETEGAMRASAEYLFCGIPVVTTPSKGGRDRMFTAENSITVDPTPDSVAQGVRELTRRSIQPTRIRHSAFRALRGDRIRLLQLAAAIHAEEGVRFATGADWQQLFRRGTWPQTTVGDLFATPAVSETRPGRS